MVENEGINEQKKEEESDEKLQTMKNLLASDQTFTGRNMDKHIKEKVAIACYIADKIVEPNPNASILLDAGSTNRIIAREILIRNILKHLSLTIVTNNMDIVEDYRHLEWLKSSLGQQQLSPYDLPPDLHLTGGLLDRKHHALAGPIGTLAIKTINFDIVIMGTSGFCFDKGLYYRSAISDQSVKEETYSKPVGQRIIAFDHSKLGKTDLFLCKSKLANEELPEFERAIGSIKEGVSDRVIIITSEPDDVAEATGINKMIDDGFIKAEKNSIIDKLKNSDPKIHLVQVKYIDKYPYYEIPRVIPEDSTLQLCT